MSVTLTINDDSLRNQLNELNKLGLSMGRVLKVETRRLLKDIVRLTHPKNRAEGETAAARDLRRVFMPLEPAQMRLAKRLNKHGGQVVAAVDYVPLWAKDGKIWGTARENFKPGMTEQEMHALHQSKRVKGRVRKAGHAKAAVISRRLTVFNRTVVSRQPFKRYERQVLSRVGKMRAGFAQGLQKLGEAVPNWVSRNIGPSVGYVSIDIADGNPKPVIAVSNQSPGVVEKMGETVQRAVNARAMAIAKNIARMVKHGPGTSGDYGYATE